MKKHILRNIFLVFLSIIVLLFIVVGVLIIDFTDNTPEYIDEVKDTNLSDFLGDKAKRIAKETGIFEDYKYLFDVEEINKILAMTTRNINIPLVNIKSIYLDIDDIDEVKGEAPFYLLFYKSLAKLNFTISYDDEKITLKIADIRVRNFSSTKGIVKSILNVKRINKIMESLNEEGIEIKLWKEDYYIYAQMTNIDVVKTIINCTKEDSVGFLVAALVAGSLNSNTIDIVINENGLTGIIVHKRLL